MVNRCGRRGDISSDGGSGRDLHRKWAAYTQNAQRKPFFCLRVARLSGILSRNRGTAKFACRFPVEYGHSAMRGDSGRSAGPSASAGFALAGVQKRTATRILFPVQSIAPGTFAACWAVTTVKADRAPRDFIRTTLGPRKCPRAVLRVRTSKCATAQHAGVHRHCSGLSEGSDATSGDVTAASQSRPEVAGLGSHTFWTLPVIQCQASILNIT